MCNLVTWTDFVKGCLYEPSVGLQLLTTELFAHFTWYGVLFLAIAVLWLLQLIHIVRLARLDNKSHLRLGWIAGGTDSDGITRGFHDYRMWTFVISTLGTVAVLMVFILYDHPRNLLEDLGLTTEIPWQLSPSGVALVLRYLRMWWVGSCFWILISACAVFIIGFDPYAYRKYRIRSVGAQPEQESQPEQEFYGPVYFPKDGGVCSSTKDNKQDNKQGNNKDNNNWLTLEWKNEQGEDETGKWQLEGIGIAKCPENDGLPWVTDLPRGTHVNLHVDRGDEFFVGTSDKRYRYQLL